MFDNQQPRTDTKMRHPQISSQAFKIITQYGDMLVVKQGVQQQHQQHHHHHSHHHPSLASTTGNQQHQQQQYHNHPPHLHHLQHHPHHHLSHNNRNQSLSSSGEQQQQQQPPAARPVIMTFHDLGLNSELQFATFCECDEVKLMLQTFTIIHVNFIGQEFNLDGQPVCSLPDDFKYPTVEQMAECIVDICAQLRVRSFVALAVGAGAHIVSSLALIRPDLVHGLFLINPVISSCSITEWLCYKMSTIASNHQLTSGGGGGGGSSHSSGEEADLAPTTGSPEKSRHQHHHHDHHHHHMSSLGKLWNAVHHHHHHSSSSSTHSPPSGKHHHSQQQHHQAGTISDGSSVSLGAGSSQTADTKSVQSGSSLGHATAESDQQQQQQELQQSSTSLAATSTSSGATKKPASHRLRQLILSRNFRMNFEKRPQSASPAASLERHDEGSTSSCSAGKSSATNSVEQLEEVATANTTTTTSSLRDSRSDSVNRSSGARRLSDSHSSSRGGGGGAPRPSSPSGRSNKRPPIEYLMYHHFGSTSFQRLRRHSSSTTMESSTAASGNSPVSTPRKFSGAGQEAELQGELDRQDRHRSSCDSSGSGQVAAVAAANLLMRHSGRQNSRGSTSDNSNDNIDNSEAIAKQSQDNSPAHTTGGTPPTASTSSALAQRHQQHQQQQRQQRQQGSVRRRHRSASVLLSAQHLASIASSRQRVAYMQDVYKLYFTRINSHNLWLFAQSFVKRRALNLRKDCGAAAHAAAAAAALGTSICAAFVGGIGPTPAPMSDGSIAGASASSSSSAVQVAGTSGDKSKMQTAAQLAGISNQPQQLGQFLTAKEQQLQQRQQQQQQAPAQPQPQPQALVAGTKVKRTFTCQTLIMCSSVHIHCERTLKLMSLLNPLQATWIKTDQMLVLEEKPEKVCQALRLFLQGIGYSMSTYERRLRLSSAQASLSSADSNGSERSLGELASTSAAAAAAPSQQPEKEKEEKEVAADSPSKVAT